MNAFSAIRSMNIYNKAFSGLHVVAVFNDVQEDLNEQKVIKKLNEQQITAFPLSKCYITKSKQKGLIFGYSAVNENLLNKKLNLLKKIIH